jgi:hypothetical protein
VFGPFDDLARAALKMIGGAEQEVEQHSGIEQEAHEAVAALHRAADSMEKHVEVLERVAATLPQLTAALVTLTEQLGEVLHLAAPLEAAEREVAGLGHLFRRRRGGSADAGAAAPVPPHVGSPHDGSGSLGEREAAAEAAGEVPADPLGAADPLSAPPA